MGGVAAMLESLGACCHDTHPLGGDGAGSDTSVHCDGIGCCTNGSTLLRLALAR